MDNDKFKDIGKIMETLRKAANSPNIKDDQVFELQHPTKGIIVTSTGKRLKETASAFVEFYDAQQAKDKKRIFRSIVRINKDRETP